MHQCPVRQCIRDVQDQFLMCGVHWRMVPGHLQAAVWHHYRHGAGVVNGLPTLSLANAQMAAIDAVNRQSRAAGRSAADYGD